MMVFPGLAIETTADVIYNDNIQTFYDYHIHAMYKSVLISPTGNEGVTEALGSMKSLILHFLDYQNDRVTYSFAHNISFQ